ncbi:alpha/beta hydrolase [Rhabdochromatium marinum]|uniref:alpha/beta hydrolase n=1 Tax=Rhabdochromatium marinum TaxID=48729 RepID=UPI001902CBBF|nr:alpha/beta hydrolase [Rhabdochromatium marinum]
MKTIATIISLLTLALLIPAGCTWLSRSEGPEGGGMAVTGMAIEDHALALGSGKPLDYRLYQAGQSSGRQSSDHVAPFSPDAPPLIILAHGFLRDQRTMQGLALALAQAGYPVATLNFRHDSLFSGGHVNNSRDMIALARHLGAKRVIYAGFSAGGLAALLAARNDPQAIGVLTLDLVDSQALGVTAAKGLELPVVALAGAPTNCNANGNANSVYQVLPRLSLTRFPQANHCAFESPSDWLCRTLCAKPEPPAATQTQAAVSSLEPEPDPAGILRTAVAGVQQIEQSLSD